MKHHIQDDCGPDGCPPLVEVEELPVAIVVSRGWTRYGEGCWRHRPWWKVLANKILRFFQTRKRPARLLVVVTKSEEDWERDDQDLPPVATGYGLARVLHIE